MIAIPMPGLASAVCQDKPSSAASSISGADLMGGANTSLSVYAKMPDAQKLTIYSQVARFYIAQERKAEPAYATQLESYLIPTEENRGNAVGYEVFVRYAAEVVGGHFAKQGVTSDTARVYGTVRHVGNSYIEELKDESKNK